MAHANNLASAMHEDEKVIKIRGAVKLLRMKLVAPDVPSSRNFPDRNSHHAYEMHMRYLPKPRDG